MKWSIWFDTFLINIVSPCVFSMNELREAHKNGKTAKSVALANDALASEYAEVYGDAIAA